MKRFAAALVVLFLATKVPLGVGADEPHPLAETPPALVGFWVVNAEGMREDPRFEATLASEQGAARLNYAEGVLFEFTSDGRLRSHMGQVDEHEISIQPHEDGTITFDPGTGPWTIEFLDENSFAQSFVDDANNKLQLLYTRTWEPLAGHWLVATPPLLQESWFSSMNEQERAALQPEIDGLQVTIKRDGSFAANIGGERVAGAINIESTTPPAGSLLPNNADKPIGHFVRRDNAAALYEGTRVWPLRRENPPSERILGRWRFDFERATTLPWIKKAAGESPVDEFLRDNVNLEGVVEITPTKWHGIDYLVVDERADQFAIRAQKTIPFWVKVIDDDHFSQMGGYGREFPYVRAEDDTGTGAPVGQ